MASDAVTHTRGKLLVCGLLWISLRKRHAAGKLKVNQGAHSAQVLVLPILFSRAGAGEAGEGTPARPGEGSEAERALGLARIEPGEDAVHMEGGGTRAPRPATGLGN